MKSLSGKGYFLDESSEQTNKNTGYLDISAEGPLGKVKQGT